MILDKIKNQHMIAKMNNTKVVSTMTLEKSEIIQMFHELMGSYRNPSESCRNYINYVILIGTNTEEENEKLFKDHPFTFMGIRIQYKPDPEHKKDNWKKSNETKENTAPVFRFKCPECGTIDFNHSDECIYNKEASSC